MHRVVTKILESSPFFLFKGGGGISKLFAFTIFLPSQHFEPCVKGVEWGFGMRGFRMVTGRGYARGRRSPTLETRCHRDTFLVASYDTQRNGGRILPCAHRGLIIMQIIMMQIALIIMQMIQFWLISSNITKHRNINDLLIRPLILIGIIYPFHS